MEAEAIIAAIALAASVLGAVLLTAWRGGAKLTHLEDTQETLCRRISRVEDIVQRELTPNGGRSIKDQLTDLHHRQSEVRRNQQHIITLLERQADESDSTTT